MAKIKEVLGKALRKTVILMFSKSLSCTDQKRPVSELFDKTTHFKQTGQMQLVITPLANSRKLLGAVYLDNYICKPDNNKYEDMIDNVRRVGAADRSQVENGAADGAYEKSDKTYQLYEESLGVYYKEEGLKWVQLQWDEAHKVDLAEGDAQTELDEVKKVMDLCQNITMVFRWGKEYKRVFVGGEGDNECVSVRDNEIEIERELQEEIIRGDGEVPKYQPVIQSNLKFAAHGHKFLFNFAGNLRFYITRFSDIQNEDDAAKKKTKAYGFLCKIDVEFVTVVYGLCDVYLSLYRAQHGVCKVNQLPWEFNDKVQVLISELQNISNHTHNGRLSKNKDNLLKGLLEDGSPIIIEKNKGTRSSTEVNPEAQVSKGMDLVREFSKSLIENIQDRCGENGLSSLMKSVFYNWKEDDLVTLLDIAHRSGRSYGNCSVLREEYRILKECYTSLSEVYRTKPEVEKWLIITQKASLFQGIQQILHFALCCFVKSPLEATAETLGSVINQHGSKDRQSMRASTLSTEVQVAWNGPQEFSKSAQVIIKDALEDYFKDHKSGVRFYVKLNIISSTIVDYINRPSSIDL